MKPWKWILFGSSYLGVSVLCLCHLTQTMGVRRGFVTWVVVSAGYLTLFA